MVDSLFKIVPDDMDNLADFICDINTIAENNNKRFFFFIFITPFSKLRSSNNGNGKRSR